MFRLCRLCIARCVLLACLLCSFLLTFAPSLQHGKRWSELNSARAIVTRHLRYWNVYRNGTLLVDKGPARKTHVILAGDTLRLSTIVLAGFLLISPFYNKQNPSGLYLPRNGKPLSSRSGSASSPADCRLASAFLYVHILLAHHQNCLRTHCSPCITYNDRYSSCSLFVFPRDCAVFWPAYVLIIPARAIIYFITSISSLHHHTLQYLS